MVKIERIDTKDSFITTLVFTNGNQGQEISVYVWEADTMEVALKSMPLSIVQSFYDKTGSKIIKEWE
jgi:hypothetical protein